jgi:hypothetical protein
VSIDACLPCRLPSSPSLLPSLPPYLPTYLIKRRKDAISELNLGSGRLAQGGAPRCPPSLPSSFPPSLPPSLPT